MFASKVALRYTVGAKHDFLLTASIGGQLGHLVVSILIELLRQLVVVRAVDQRRFALFVIRT